MAGLAFLEGNLFLDDVGSRPVRGPNLIGNPLQNLWLNAAAHVFGINTVNVSTPCFDVEMLKNHWQCSFDCHDINLEFLGICTRERELNRRVECVHPQPFCVSLRKLRSWSGSAIEAVITLIRSPAIATVCVHVSMCYPLVPKPERITYGFSETRIHVPCISQQIDGIQTVLTGGPAIGRP